MEFDGTLLSKMWDNVNLSLVAIATTLTFVSVLDDHVVACEETTLVNNFCSVSLNVWGVTADGMTAVEAAVASGALMIQSLQAIPIVHFVVSFIGWLMLTWDLKLSGAITTALGHISGWVLLGVVLSNELDVKDIVDALSTDDYSSTDFTFGFGFISSVVATGIQLLAVGSILVKELFVDNNYLDFIVN
jgi:hypothetical protein